MQLRCKLAARLRERAQIRQIHAEETDALEHLIGKRYTAERGRLVVLHEAPELLGDNRLGGQQHGRADQRMAVDDGQAVCIVHRQRRHRTLGLIQLEVFDNRLGVGLDVGVALTNQLRTSGRTGGGQQQRQLIVQRVNRLIIRLDQRIAEAGEDDRIRILFKQFVRQVQIRRAVDIQQMLCEHVVDLGVHHQRYNLVVQEAEIARRRADCVLAEAEHQAPLRNRFAQLLCKRLELCIAQRFAVLLEKCGFIPKFSKTIVVTHTSFTFFLYSIVK